MRRGNLAERTAPDGWILHCVQNDIRESASTAHKPPRVMLSGVKRSRNISWKGNDVNCRKYSTQTTTCHCERKRGNLPGGKRNNCPHNKNKTKKNKIWDKVF